MQKPVDIAQANLNMDPTYDAPAPMTEAQEAELKALCDRLDEPFDNSLTQQQARERIRLLEHRDAA